MRRVFGVFVSCCIVTLPVMAGDLTDPEPAPPVRPNVLLVVTDDQRRDGTLEFMPKTMQWLGLGGTQYTEAYSAAAICCPARAGIWTGQYIHNNKVLTTANVGGLLDEDSTIQRYLKDAGYTTGAFGKFFNSFPTTRNPKYFDDYAFHNSGYTNVQFRHNGIVKTVPYSPTFVWNEALGFLGRTESDDTRPWYLYVSPYAPHSPWIPEEKYRTVLFPPWLGNPATLEVDRSDKPPHVQATVPLLSASVGAPWDRGPEGVTTLGEVGTNVPVDRHTYLRTLLTVDDMMDSLLSWLAANGELDNTLVIFTSDQGYTWGEHGWYNKMVPYTTSIQVPFLMRWDAGGVAAGATSDRLVSGVDILPTILDAADLEAAPAAAGKLHDGRSIFGPDGGREYVLTEFTSQNLPLTNPVPTWASIRAHDWQYVEYRNAQGGVTFRELYDLVADPWQLENRFRAANLVDPVTPAEAAALQAKLTAARACKGTTGALACP